MCQSIYLCIGSYFLGKDLRKTESIIAWCGIILLHLIVDFPYFLFSITQKGVTSDPVPAVVGIAIIGVSFFLFQFFLKFCEL